MTVLEFTVPGRMRGKGRARSTKSGHHYTPEPTVNAEAFVKACCLDAMRQIGCARFDGPVKITVNVWADIPKTWSKKKKEQAIRGEIIPTSKPDLDNILKLIKDALNKLAWKDDSQVSDIISSKRYTDQAETYIRVEAAQ